MARCAHKAKSSYQGSKFDDSNRVSNYQKIKDTISYVLTFPDFASPWLIPALFKGLTIIRKHKIDIIFATGMPWTSLIIGYFLKIITRKKLIIDFRDPWVNNPFIEKMKFQKSMDRRWEKRIVKKADLIIANTNLLKQDLISRYLHLKDKIIHLPNGFDESDFSSIRIENNNSDSFIMTHAGFLYGRRDPMPLFEAIRYLQNINPRIASKIKFQQIGDINLNYNLVDMIQAKALEKNIVLIDQLEYQQSLSALAQSDVLLIFQQGTKNQIPSKFYEYIYLDKPIISIAEKESELSQQILQNGFGSVFEDEDVAAIADHIIQLYQLKIDGKLANFKYPNKEKFNIKNITSILQQEIEDLLPSSS